MRFLDLRLIAFGPFTDHTLDLSGGEQGLHVVYGANEAGKSASLRAISALLYGIPLRTQDNFLHPYPELRLGARLRRVSGEEAVFLRRKARDKTLLDADGNPLPDDALTPFLGIADADLFARLHGIDHAMLLAGGQEMKELRGDIGATLFAAGLGSGVNALLSGLAAEEKALAAPRTPQGITRLLDAYKQCKKESNALALRSGEWQEADAARRRLGDEIAALDEAILAQGRERSRLERMARNLRRFVRRARLQAEIEAMGAIVKLPAAYSAARRQQAVIDLAQARVGQKRLANQLAEIANELAAITVPRQLLDQGERVAHLYEERNTHLTAAVDRDKLVTKRIQYENDARLLLRDLAPTLTLGEAEQLRLTRAELAQLRKLCVDYQSVHQAPRQLAEAIEQLDREVVAMTSELAALPPGDDPLPLSRLLRELAGQGDQEQLCAEAHGACRAAEAEARQGLARLGCRLNGEAGLATLLATAFPAPESVDRFDHRFRDLDQKILRLHERQDEAAQDIARLDTEIEALRRSGHILTEADLHAIRQERDTAWETVKAAWLDGEPPPGGAEELATTYQSLVGDADAASDRLRREAARVQQMVRLTVDRERTAEQAAILADRHRALAGERRELAAAWRAAWPTEMLEPGGPVEMRGWLSRCERVMAQATEYFETRSRAQELDQAVAASRARFNATLARYGEGDEAATLAELRHRAEERVDRLNRLSQQRERLDAGLKEREATLALKRQALGREEQRLAQWREEWRRAVAKLPLEPARATPEQVDAVIGQLDDLFDRIGKLEETTVRVRAIERNRAAYGQAVAGLVAEVAPELGQESDTEAVTRLFRHLTRARTDAVRQEELRRQQDSLTRQGRELADTEAGAQTLLAGLCREVGCADHEALPAIEERWGEFTRRDGELRRCEEEIVDDGGGLTLAGLAAELDGVDADLLRARIDNFEGDLHELNRQKDEKGRELYDQEGKLARMDGNDRAAEAAEEAALAGAEVGRAVNRYLRVKLAGGLLRRRIEEHRRNSQSPVLAQANAFFRRLTTERFQELATDFDHDQQILVGVRAGGEKVRVEAMSDGTRDQLYLALRLGYLAHELDKGRREPMPLVLDDLLMNFDDQRAAAALKILAELSDRTQVIYFTHHAHLLELAQKAVAAPTLQLHQL